MTIPQYKLLTSDAVRKARLVTIRDAITPLLATNYLSYFTDHSVNHSDRLCEIVDDLTVSLDEKRRLSSIEAAILYTACYFHDAGMQHQRAGDTEAIVDIIKKPPYSGQTWDSLTLLSKQLLVRQHHNEISKELVLRAMHANSAIGITLKDDDYPGIVASLCLAHCIPTDSSDYINNTANQGKIRVDLLSALLRLADILDESRRRSHLHLESTTELSLESRLHWWRHYYVSEISIEPQSIIIWFDFPPSRRSQYKEIFEPLQIPLIEDEFARHSSVLSTNGLAWNRKAHETAEAQSTARVMDSELERFAIEKAAKQHSEQLRQERASVARQLRMARPTLEREFAALRNSPDAADTRLQKALDLANHLSNIGGTRDAWTSLLGLFNKIKTTVSLPLAQSVMLRISELMVHDLSPDLALRHLQEYLPQFSNLPDGDPEKLRFLRVWAIVLRDNCQYSKAIETFTDLARISDSLEEKQRALAEISEMHFLQGEVEKLSDGELK